MYKQKILPLEKDYKFEDFHSPGMTDTDFDAKPMVLLIGQYSTGKSHQHLLHSTAASPLPPLTPLSSCPLTLPCCVAALCVGQRLSNTCWRGTFLGLTLGLSPPPTASSLSCTEWTSASYRAMHSQPTHPNPSPHSTSSAWPSSTRYHTTPSHLTPFHTAQETSRSPLALLDQHLIESRDGAREPSR